MIKRIILMIIIPAAFIFLGLKFVTISNENYIAPHPSKSSGKIEDSPFQKEYLNKGGIIIVNVWATWCEPCVQEMPVFKKLIKENPDKKFVFLSIDENTENLKFVAENKINDITLQNIKYIEAIKNFLGGNGVLGYSAIPLTFIIKDGKIIDKSVGSIDYTELSNKLKALQ
ncbi:TlpA family protein disulfide reductase [Chryseobacterium gleum]|uniref:TlpA family protein disulfide reductase n=1 Tax=Chryseobacterium gleum TaxID=250 RepID=UPI00103CF697|nr:TlpA disulfide reductase family protein [Chryseobacterium gleum]QBJ85739.1 TlpA family protein disulfide reductase [Chryseobacterium gleum]